MKMVQHLLVSSFLLLVGAMTPSLAATLHAGFTKMVDVDNVMPGAGRSFQSLGIPAINHGVIVFSGKGGFLQEGLYTNLPGYIQLVADNQTVSPSNANFHSLFFKDNSDLRDIANNRILFYAALNGGNAGLYTFTNKKLNLIADTKTLMPGGQVNFQQFSWPFLFYNGTVIFIGNSGQYYGVFGTDDAGNLKLLLNANNTHIPKGTGNFTSLTELTAAHDGDETNYIFVGTGDNNQMGLYQFHQLKVSKIADKNTKIPGGSVGNFSGFSHISMFGQQGAFIGMGALGQEGVYLFENNHLVKVADVAETMPGTEGRFLHFDQLALGQDRVVFHAVNEFGDSGVFIYTPQDGLFKLLSVGDQINGQEVSDVNLGRSSVNGDNVALRIDFKKAPQGIYVATAKIADF
jgi:hypothetical protein